MRLEVDARVEVSEVKWKDGDGEWGFGIGIMHQCVLLMEGGGGGVSSSFATFRTYLYT